ncbi:hypothetical protein NEOLEDRAFT_1140890 [Neolentinus lepideus HHB14362 ss-1]|uniref:Uncharacterized protein n=1 Tax=Neolentinus lepideus HHB14362 ss-1 TaxID=1314782 RepID=A0A165NYW9_9AGAM|nr:hypothetical protein NEOLEDRAFT_1140890 [Neolentinus lepideus HHB14362 ss-1]
MKVPRSEKLVEDSETSYCCRPKSPTAPLQSSSCGVRQHSDSGCPSAVSRSRSSACPRG